MELLGGEKEVEGRFYKFIVRLISRYLTLMR